MFQFAAFSDGVSKVKQVQKSQTADQERLVRALWREVANLQLRHKEGAVDRGDDTNVSKSDALSVIGKKFDEILKAISDLGDQLGDKGLPEPFARLRLLARMNLAEVEHKRGRPHEALDLYLAVVNEHQRRPETLKSDGGILSSSGLPATSGNRDGRDASGGADVNALRGSDSGTGRPSGANDQDVMTILPRVARRKIQDKVDSRPSVTLYRKLALLAFEMGKLPLARNAIEAAISMDPNSFLLYGTLLDILYSMEHCDPLALEQCADAMLAQDPNCVNALIVKVKVVNEDVNRESNEKQRAMDTFRMARAVQPALFAHEISRLKALRERFRILSNDSKEETLTSLVKLDVSTLSSCASWTQLVKRLLNLARFHLASGATYSAVSQPNASDDDTAMEEVPRQELSSKRRRDSLEDDAMADDRTLDSPKRQRANLTGTPGSSHSPKFSQTCSASFDSVGENLRSRARRFLELGVDPDEFMVHPETLCLKKKQNVKSTNAMESSTADASKASLADVEVFLKSCGSKSGIFHVIQRFIRHASEKRLSPEQVDHDVLAQLSVCVNEFCGSPEQASGLLYLAEVHFDRAVHVATRGVGMVPEAVTSRGSGAARHVSTAPAGHLPTGTQAMTTTDRAAVRDHLALVDTYMTKLHSLVAIVQNGRANPGESQIDDDIELRMRWLAAKRAAFESVSSKTREAEARFDALRNILKDRSVDSIFLTHFMHDRVISIDAVENHLEDLRAFDLRPQASLALERRDYLAVVDLLSKSMLADRIVGVPEKDIDALLAMLHEALAKLDGGMPTFLLRCRVKRFTRMVASILSHDSADDVRALCIAMNEISYAITNLERRTRPTALSPAALFELKWCMCACLNRSLSNTSTVASANKPSPFYSYVTLYSQVCCDLDAHLSNDFGKCAELQRYALSLLSERGECLLSDGAFPYQILRFFREREEVITNDVLKNSAVALCLAQTYKVLFGISLPIPNSKKFSRRQLDSRTARGGQLKLTSHTSACQLYRLASRLRAITKATDDTSETSEMQDETDSSSYQSMCSEVDAHFQEVTTLVSECIGCPPPQLLCSKSDLTDFIDGRSQVAPASCPLADFISTPSTSADGPDGRVKMSWQTFVSVRQHLSDSAVDEAEIDLFSSSSSAKHRKSALDRIEALLLDSMACKPQAWHPWYWLAWSYLHRNDILTFDARQLGQCDDNVLGIDFDDDDAHSSSNLPKMIAAVRRATQRLFRPVLQARRCFKQVLELLPSDNDADREVRHRIFEVLGCVSLRMLRIHALVGATQDGESPPSSTDPSNQLLDDVRRDTPFLGSSSLNVEAPPRLKETLSQYLPWRKELNIARQCIQALRDDHPEEWLYALLLADCMYLDPTSKSEQYLAMYADAVAIVNGSAGSGIQTIGSTRAPGTLAARGDDAKDLKAVVEPMCALHSARLRLLLAQGDHSESLKVCQRFSFAQQLRSSGAPATSDMLVGDICSAFDYILKIDPSHWPSQLGYAIACARDAAAPAHERRRRAIAMLTFSGSRCATMIAAKQRTSPSTDRLFDVLGASPSERLRAFEESSPWHVAAESNRMLHALLTLLVAEHDFGTFLSVFTKIRDDLKKVEIYSVYMIELFFGELKASVPVAQDTLFGKLLQRCAEVYILLAGEPKKPSDSSAPGGGGDAKIEADEDDRPRIERPQLLVAAHRLSLKLEAAKSRPKSSMPAPPPPPPPPAATLSTPSKAAGVPQRRPLTPRPRILRDSCTMPEIHSAFSWAVKQRYLRSVADQLKALNAQSKESKLNSDGATLRLLVKCSKPF